MATQLELGDFISIDTFSTSNDERDFPKYLNIKFDFCEDEVEIPESEGDDASVKLSSCRVLRLLSAPGFFLCLMRDVRMIRIMTANVAPVPIATSNRSPCDWPSMDTLETFEAEKKFKKIFHQDRVFILQAIDNCDSKNENT